MIVSRVLAALALVLLVGACGSASEAESPPSPPASAPPAPVPPAPSSGPLDPPPTLSANGPPAAWIETEAGAFWLGYSTYCWKNVCADYMAPSCRRGSVPEIAVRSGEEVRFHLGFEPTSVVLTFFGTSIEQEELTASATPAWRVQRDGAIAVFSTADGRDASYAACLRFTDEVGSEAPVPGGALSVAEALESELDGPLLVEGALVAVGDEVRLCSALAESYPPQCGRPSLVVQGLELETVEGLTREGGVAWAESTSVLGTVEDGTLEVTQTAA